MTPNVTQSVLILGGGPAGLTAAYRLAQQGRRVALLDQAAIPGGNLTHEYSFSPCILGCHYATWRLLHSLGSISDRRMLKETTLELRLPNGRLVRYPQSRFPTPLHILFTVGRFAGLSWTERWKLLSWLEEMWEGSLQLATDLEHRTAQEWLTSLGHSNSLQQSIWNPIAQWLTGNDLRLLSADALVASLTPFFLKRPSDNRIITPQYPWRTLLIKPILDHLAQQGGIISLETQAVQLQYEQDRMTGVRLGDGSLLEADWYVSALPHHQLLPLLPERWLSRYAYFQQISELTTGPRTLLHIVASERLKGPRLILLSDSLFQWMQAQCQEKGPSLFSLVMTNHPEKPQDAERQASSLLQSLGLIQTSSAITAMRSYEIPHSLFFLSPGTKARRPIHKSPIANLLLAGAWTDTGWPANVESAIVSGERCASVISGNTDFPY